MNPLTWLKDRLTVPTEPAYLSVLDVLDQPIGSTQTPADLAAHALHMDGLASPLDGAA